MEWTIDNSKSPQFSYHLEIYNNITFYGKHIYTNSTIRHLAPYSISDLKEN